MDVFLFLVFVALLVFSVAAWPAWPYTRERWVYRSPGRWRYAPSVTLAGLALVIFVLFWLGLVAIAWPWVSVPVQAG